MEFQIQQNYGQGCGGYVYFTTTGHQTIDQLKIKAKQVIKKEWNKIKSSSFFMHIPTPARPTIKVVEYNPETGMKVRGGISFKTKWR